jgi:hypothetical protein
VKHISALRAKAIKDKSGNPMIDEFTLSEDRRDTFLIFAREAADKVFAKLSAYAKGIQNAYIFNEQIDYDKDNVVSDFENAYQVHMAINPDYELMDINIFSLVDQRVLDGIVYYILSQWFRTQGVPDDYMLYEKYAVDACKEISLKIGQAEGKRGITFKNFF